MQWGEFQDTAGRLAQGATEGERECRSQAENEALWQPELSHPDHRLVSRPKSPSQWAEGSWGETHGRNPVTGVDLPGRESGSSPSRC